MESSITLIHRLDQHNDSGILENIRKLWLTGILHGELERRGFSIGNRESNTNSVSDEPSRMEACDPFLSDKQLECLVTGISEKTEITVGGSSQFETEMSSGRGQWIEGIEEENNSDGGGHSGREK